MVETYDVVPVEGYETEVGLLLASLEDSTREWREELDDLSEDQLVSPSFPTGPMIGAILLHLAEAETWWIRSVVGGTPLSPEFRKRLRLDVRYLHDDGRWNEAPRMSPSEYFEVLDEIRRQTREVLSHERDPARRIKPDPDRPALTVRWIVSHLVQHEAYHGGQAVMIKRMLMGGVW